MTNGDRIRFFRSLLNHYAGKDQEIAKEDICPYDREETCQDYIDCFTCRLKWLREESEYEPSAGLKRRRTKMLEQMTKQDAIEYLLYMKHDVQAKSPMDIALDIAIEALKQPTIDAEPVRHGEWHECWHTDTVCASICTNCGKAATQARVIVGQELMTNVRFPLCPNCGAKMYQTGGTISKERFTEIMGGADNG